MVLRRVLACSALSGAALLLSVGSASAAGPTLQQIDCGGQSYTIRTNNNNSSDHGGFSAAQVVSGGSGHFIPQSFAFSAYDNTTSSLLFSGTEVKGQGNANQNQATTTCTTTMTGTLADLLGPGETAPPGVQLTDSVTATFSVVAVARP